MRPLAAALAIIALSFLLTMPAAASCRPPVFVAENAAGAEAVVYGTVIAASSRGLGGDITVRIDRVMKGQVGPTVRVFLGPSRSSNMLTSVDYLFGDQAKDGSDHVLYLIRGADGQLETNACIGSHPGVPSAEELAYFGAGTSPSAGSPTPAPVTAAEAPVPVAPVLPIWYGLVLVIVAGAAILLLRRRAALGAASSRR